MIVDFTKITIYELLALILAGIAILIPIIQWAWKKWVVTPVLVYHPIGRGMLFFNQSGSYIRIDGVYEAKRKAIFVEKIAVTVKRQKDDQKLNLMWSSFISPINQNVFGNYLQTTESAHPFRLEEDSIQCVFTEFGDSFDSFGKTFRANTDVLFSKVLKIRDVHKDYISAVSEYKNTQEYIVAEDILSKEFFWEIGKYDIDIEVTYGKQNKCFHYIISIGEQENKLLKSNIEESLVSPLKNTYGMRWDYHVAIVELQMK